MPQGNYLVGMTEGQEKKRKREDEREGRRNIQTRREMKNNRASFRVKRHASAAERISMDRLVNSRQKLKRNWIANEVGARDSHFLIPF